MIRLRNFQDGVDGFNLRHQRQISLLLFMRDGEVVERAALLLGQHFQNVARGDAAERHKSGLRENEGRAAA